MGLRVKFLILLSACLTVSVATTTLIFSHHFSANQEANISDVQSLLATINRQRLEERMELLYSQLATMAPQPVTAVEKALVDLPGCLRAKVIDRSGDSPSFGSTAGTALGQSGRWSLMAPFSVSGQRGLRWVGKFSQRIAELDLSLTWFSSILMSSHGVAVQVIDA